MIKVIFFDMDGTLYKSAIIKQKFAEAAYYTLSKFQEITLENAQKLIEKRRETLKKTHGSSVPYTLTLKSFGVPVEYWHNENVDYFDPRDYLGKDEGLRRNIMQLKEYYRLAVLTNNNKIQTERTIIALGLTNMFEKVYTYNSFELLKPDPEFLRKALEDLGVEPNTCVFIGDRYNVDLEPAEKVGIHIHQVSGPEDIGNLFDIIRNIAEGSNDAVE